MSLYGQKLHYCPLPVVYAECTPITLAPWSCSGRLIYIRLNSNSFGWGIIGSVPIWRPCYNLTLSYLIPYVIAKITVSLDYLTNTQNRACQSRHTCLSAHELPLRGLYDIPVMSVDQPVCSVVISMTCMIYYTQPSPLSFKLLIFVFFK